MTIGKNKIVIPSHVPLSSRDHTSSIGLTKNGTNPPLLTEFLADPKSTLESTLNVWTWPDRLIKTPGVSTEIIKAYTQLDRYVNLIELPNRKSITIEPYDWAILDLALRRLSEEYLNLHLAPFKGSGLKCRNDLCYCHSLLNSPSLKQIAREIYEYSKQLTNGISTLPTLDRGTKTALDGRLSCMYGDLLSTETNPTLVLDILIGAHKVQF